MAEENAEVGRRRRLPTWMVGATASATAAVDDQDRKKTTTGDPEEGNPNLPRNSIPPRTRANTSKRRKAKVATFRNREEVPTHDDDDDDAGLTVEDLVTIAQEYVKVNQYSESKRPLNQKCEPQGQHATITSSSNDLEGPFLAPFNEQQLPSSETTASCSSSMNLTSEQSLIKVSHTGDPAQDMLDLFLGPLLKKPPLEDEKRSGLFSKDTDLVFELRKRSQNDVGEEIVPVTKKKSSLKDKVLP
ncbi:hypothetical protein MANES_07G076000v8 [Manihot esculenta]|uniref:Uncharacterized protein n=1 Tax=Manihot esculenta TaxID=3983 RepID=A0ACB7HGF2_MANES|nr:hypothetical protein MANES_07G076000v8 [Manihot esculenta]